jgi:type I restriction enzyme R subunit
VSADGLHAEQRARVLIDAQLAAAGWHVCDLSQLDLIHHPNCGVREVPMKKGAGQVDYLLYVERKIVGVIEAKPIGTPLSGVEWQSSMYADGLSAAQQLQSIAVAGRLPFVFEAPADRSHGGLRPTDCNRHGLRPSLWNRRLPAVGT